MKRYSTTGASNIATIRYQDRRWETGEMKTVTREFWAPLEGGYIYDVTLRPGTLGNQVCDGLASRGSTLRWSGKGDLVETIRREARKFFAQREKEQTL